MHRLSKAIAFSLLMLSASGCSTVSGLLGGGSVAGSNPDTVAKAEQALTIAHLAYDGVGTALKAAASSGTLHGSAAATAKTYYDKAGDALSVADKADDSVNAQGIMSAVTTAEDAINQANALIHPKVTP